MWEDGVDLTQRFTSSSPIPNPRTWSAYRSITEKLMELYSELGQSENAELDQRVKSYAASMETSVSAKEKEGDIHTLDHKLDIINIKADIRIKEALRDLLLTALQHGVEIV